MFRLLNLIAAPYLIFNPVLLPLKLLQHPNMSEQKPKTARDV